MKEYMTKYTEEVRKIVPNEAVKDFDDIVTSRILGATNHIKMICNIFLKISQIESDESLILSQIDQVAYYFKMTRGNSSYAIVNALNEILYGINERCQNGENTRDAVIGEIECFLKQSDEDVRKIIKYALSQSEKYRSVLIFDYSSTVDKFIAELDENVAIYVPESRCINGGFPFLKTATRVRRQVYFFPDVYIAEAIKKCDACYIGVETFFLNGTAFNTIGSDIVAKIAKLENKPLFALTPLIKVDMRSLHGFNKLRHTKDFKYKFGLVDSSLLENVDCCITGLIGIDPNCITAFITEYGIITSQQLLTVIYMNKPGYMEVSNDAKNE